MPEYGSKFDWSSNAPYLGGKGLRMDGAAWYRSGRDALRALASLPGERPTAVLLPALCCESMVLPFAQCGLDVAFYRMAPDLSGSSEDLLAKLQDGAMLVYMRYFGIRPFSDDFLASLRTRYRGLTLVEDRTHDIIIPRQGDCFRPDATLASARKWAALPEGGLLVCDAGTPAGESDGRFRDMQREAMEKKSRFLRGSAEDGPEDYLELFRRSEALLDESSGPRAISADCMSLIDGMDFEGLLSRRRKNVARLKALLAPAEESGRLRFLSQTPEDSTLYFPILLDDRDAVQRELGRRRVYCPVIWPAPDRARGLCPAADETVAHMLALPCDQRYGESDMDAITAELLDVLGGE